MSLAKIGQILNQEREHKGLSLTQVSEWTCISEGQLKALEEGDIKALPARAYVRGFIQAYSKSIGIKDQPLLDLFGTAASDAPLQEIKKVEDLNKGFSRMLTLGHISLMLAIVVFSGLIFWMRQALDKYNWDYRKTQSISEILHNIENKGSALKSDKEDTFPKPHEEEKEIKEKKPENDLEEKGI